MTEFTWPNAASVPVDLFVRQYMALLDNYTGFLLPNYWDSLEVITADPVVGAVYVKSGAAFLTGISAAGPGNFYTNDAQVTVAITSSAGSNRIDRIVLRAARITKIIGVEGATPAMPALTAGDIPLAWIYIPTGYNAATTIIQPYYIHDERMFSISGGEPVDFKNDMNIMHNYEFMMFSRGGLTNTPPEMWKITAGAPTACAPTTAIFTSRNFPSRCNGVVLTCNATAGITTTVPLPSYGGTYTIRFCWKATTATSFNVVISSRVLAGAATSTKTITLNRISGDPITDEIIRYTADSTSDALDITIISTGAAAGISVSPIMITQGLSTTYNFPRKSEILTTDRVLQDAFWTATAKSTGNTVINLNSSFGGNIRRGTIAVIARLTANDSGSAGAAASLTLGPSTGTYAVTTSLVTANVTNLPNDFVRSAVGYVPITYNALAVPVYAQYAASGPGTLDATVEIIGIIT